MRRRSAVQVAFWVLPMAVLAAISCGREPAEPRMALEALPVAEQARPTLTLGDIEPFEPAWRIERVQPLAELLAQRVASEGAAGLGRVVVARDIREMSRLMQDGTVDLLLDSPHPVLAVRREVGGEIILQREVGAQTEYVSVFVTRKGSAPKVLSDLAGKVIALQERHSTSGYLLPALALLADGLTLREVAPGTPAVGAGEVGFYFTRDEENTIEAVISGAAVAGAVSSQDWERLPDDFRRRLRVFHRTEPVPRQLVLARPGMSPELISRLREILLGLDDADRQWLMEQVPGGGWVWQFSRLGPDAEQRLTAIENRWPLLSQGLRVE